MKVILSFALMALVLLMSDLSSANPDLVAVTQDDSGKTMAVKVGDVIQIELMEQGSTGYLWQFDNLDRQFFDLIDLTTEKTHKEPGFTGEAVTKRWRLKAKKAGQTAIILYYFRPWEDKRTAVRTFVLTVRIS